MSHPHRTTGDLPNPGVDNFTLNLYEAICSSPTLASASIPSNHSGNGQGRAGWAPDSTLFSTFLLALIARQGGVIVECGNRNVRGTVHATAAILESIFGLYLQFIHVDPETQPHSLTQLLLQDPTDPQNRTPRPSPSVSTCASAWQSTSATFSALPSLSPNHLHRRANSNTYQIALTTTPSPIDENDGSHPMFQHHVSSPTSPTNHPHRAYSQNRASSHPHFQAQGTSGRSSSRQATSRLRSMDITNALIVTGHLGKSKVAIELVEAVTRGYAATSSSSAVKRDMRDTLVVWVKDELETDTPFWLMDMFACSIVVGELDTTPDLERNALIPASYIHDLYHLLSFTHIHPPLQIHITNLVSALLLDPRLSSTITARATASLITFTRAHRLLAAPFSLPSGWREDLDAWEKSSDVPPPGPGARLGISGGRGGVLTWARRAGEEPTLATLQRVGKSREESNGNDNGNWNGSGNGIGWMDKGDNGEDWYALPSNVQSIWNLCVRHRTRWRKKGQTSLWAMQGSARERLKESSKTGGGTGARKDWKSREERAKEREWVDDALDEILAMV